MNGGLALFSSPEHSGDKIFDEHALINRDDCLSPFRALRDELKHLGWEVHTQDVWRVMQRTPDAVLFVDAPRKPVKKALGTWGGSAVPYLLIQECEVIMPKNWDFNSHRQYNKVFTWHTELLSDPLYCEINFAQKLCAPNVDGWTSRNNRFCLIAANKRAFHPLELYSQRLRAIRWFEENHIQEFSLFGIGWDRLVLPGPSVTRKLFSKLPVLPWVLAPSFPSYKGVVSNKREYLRKHRFAICFENAKCIPGYITEKIFDCLMAGCVPIYWGAPNICDYIPQDCFIDFRQFSSYQEMYQFVANIDEKRYREIQMSICAFLESAACQRFSAEYSGRQMAEVITRGKTCK
jgi:alpha(1,3/1,4) fucosyltransferase